MAHAGVVRLFSAVFTIVHISLDSTGIVVRQLQAALGDLSIVWMRVGATQDKIRSLEKEVRGNRPRVAAESLSKVQV